METYHGTNGNGWTSEEDKVLAEQWSHITTSKLGEMLGRTKNSVISRAHRIGLKPYGTTLQQLTQRIKKKTAGTHIRETKYSFMKPKKEPRPRTIRFLRTDIEYKSEKVHVEPLNGVGVLLHELNSSHCRWILDDNKHYCGCQVTTKSSYCASHHGVVYRPIGANY